MNKKTTKGDAAAKRIRMAQDKKLKYFMENRSNEFRLKVIEPKKSREKKISPRNLEDFNDEE